MTKMHTHVPFGYATFFFFYYKKFFYFPTLTTGQIWEMIKRDYVGSWAEVGKMIFFVWWLCSAFAVGRVTLISKLSAHQSSAPAPLWWKETVEVVLTSGLGCLLDFSLEVLQALRSRTQFLGRRMSVILCSVSCHHELPFNTPKYDSWMIFVLILHFFSFVF